MRRQQRKNSFQQAAMKAALVYITRRSALDIDRNDAIRQPLLYLPVNVFDIAADDVNRSVYIQLYSHMPCCVRWKRNLLRQQALRSNLSFAFPITRVLLLSSTCVLLRFAQRFACTFVLYWHSWHSFHFSSARRLLNPLSM